MYRNGRTSGGALCRPQEAITTRYRDNFPSVPASDYDDVTPEWRLTLPSHVQNGDLVVPPGSVFAMGDNRDVSLDCRYWGFVPRENVIGRPMFIYWSFITPRDEYERQSIGDRIAWLFNICHPLLRSDALVPHVPRGALMPGRTHGG